MTRLRCSFTAEFKLEAVSLLLTGYFCERYRQAFGLPQVVMSPALCLALLHYYWPGNVRELEHAVHRAIVLARATSNSDDCCYSLITSLRKKLLNRLSALKHSPRKPIRICVRPPIPFRLGLSALPLPAVTAAGRWLPAVSALMPGICIDWQNVWG
ncbi:hypothetical protein AAGU47_17675 [Aeromonas hydrophila]|uniref:hypothetical protein n=1 Tax=Aeromonas hydrophila TaxID=644 RepID=UPI003F8289ED